MGFPAPDASNQQKAGSIVFPFYVLFSKLPSSLECLFLPFIRSIVPETLLNGTFTQTRPPPQLRPNSLSPYPDTVRPLPLLFFSDTGAFQRGIIFASHHLHMPVYDRFPAILAFLGLTGRGIAVTIHVHSSHPVFAYREGSV